MKMVVAIIRPERLGAVQTALRSVLDEAEHYRLTVQQVEGHGRLQGDVEYFRGQPITPKMVPRLQLSVAVNDKYVEPAIAAIIQAARTGAGHVGDGKIFIMPLEDCIRIRTGERGSAAI